MRAAESVSARLHIHLIETGLTHSQFAVLEALYHCGGLCQSELGQKLLKSPGNIVQVIDNLEKKGFIRRERSAIDRRYITIHLEAPGRELIEAVFPKHAQGIAAELAILTADEQAELGRLCRILGKRERSDTRAHFEPKGDVSK